MESCSSSYKLDLQQTIYTQSGIEFLFFWEKVFPFIWHIDIRDTTAQLNSDVCYNVLIESQLQTLSSEYLDLKDCRQEEDQLDIRTQRFLVSNRQIVHCKK